MAKWWEAPEVAQKAVIAKAKAWTNFLNRFPKADKSRFVAEPHFDDKLNATAEVFFKESEGSLKSIFGSDRQFWSAEMKQALGLGDSGGFPYQLLPLGSKVSLPIPAEPFGSKAPSLKKIFNAEVKIYVTPDVGKYSKKNKLRHTAGAEAKHWLEGPDMKYWPQQLNFAVFCATQGCGISRNIFDNGINLPPQIRALYIFHVYFTVRRICIS